MSVPASAAEARVVESERRSAEQRLLRLALIGPVTPFRGGIAQYTTELHRALAARCQLQTVSFRRQYPAWLYPGRSDREPGTQGNPEPGVDYVLDALNPLTWPAAARQVAARGCDLAVINWWTMFWAPGFALMARMLRDLGIPSIFLCHNVFDRGSGILKRAVATRLLLQASGYLVQSTAQAELLKPLVPGRPVVVHPHPTHDRFPRAADPSRPRGRLELLFFGFIRPYKGLDILVEALSRLADPEVHLTVVGEPWCSADELKAKIRAVGAPNVELHLEYVDDATVAAFFARADVLVVPYREATGSGVVPLAYHYDRPVLATRVGALRDVVEEGRTGFLVDPDSPDQLAERLRSLTREQLEPMRRYIATYKSRFSWGSLADTLIGLAEEIGAGVAHAGLGATVRDARE